MQTHEAAALASAIGEEMRRTRKELEATLHRALERCERDVCSAVDSVGTVREASTLLRAGVDTLTREFDDLVVALRVRHRSAADSHRRLLEQLALLREGQALTERISALANDINAISVQSRLLTLNGHVEAARLGAQGRAFMVITDQLRLMSKKVEETNRAISELASALHEMIPRLQGHTQNLLALNDEGESKAAHPTMHQALAMSRALARRVEESADGLLRNLQMHDRLAQEVADLPHLMAYAEQVLDRVLSELGQRGGEVSLVDVQETLRSARAATERVVVQMGRALETKGEAMAEGTILMF